jgi:hypothetical protein
MGGISGFSDANGAANPSLSPNRRPAIKKMETATISTPEEELQMLRKLEL